MLSRAMCTWIDAAQESLPRHTFALNEPSIGCRNHRQQIGSVICRRLMIQFRTRIGSNACIGKRRELVGIGP